MDKPTDFAEVVNSLIANLASEITKLHLSVLDKESKRIAASTMHRMAEDLSLGDTLGDTLRMPKVVTLAHKSPRVRDRRALVSTPMLSESEIAALGEKLLTTREAASAIGICMSAVLYAIHRGSLKAVRITRAPSGSEGSRGADERYMITVAEATRYRLHGRQHAAREAVRVAKPEKPGVETGHKVVSASKDTMTIQFVNPEKKA